MKFRLPAAALLLAGLGIHAPLSQAAGLTHTFTTGTVWITATWTNGAPDNGASAADGVSYAIEGSTTLSGFPVTVTPVSFVDPGVELSGPQAADYEYRSFSLNDSNGLSGKGFLRAKVTQP